MRWLICILLALCSLAAQDRKTYVITASRSGVIELLDPATLDTVARIPLNLPPNTVGINGIYASADGSKLYLEGPTPSDPHACCVLSALDLATLQLSQAASIPGTSSRAAFIFSNGLVYPAATLLPQGFTSHTRQYLSPDQRSLFAVKSFPTPAVEAVDLLRGTVRELVPPGLTEDLSGTATAGAWSGDRFYFYVSDRHASGWLWSVSPDARQLTAAIKLAPFNEQPGCRERFPIETSFTAASGNFFLYETFGWKGDRRAQCESEVPGGVWMVDAATGQLTNHIAPGCHFRRVLSDRSGSMLYGLTADTTPQLVRIDAQTGQLLNVRNVDPDAWFLSVAALQPSQF